MQDDGDGRTHHLVAEASLWLDREEPRPVNCLQKLIFALGVEELRHPPILEIEDIHGVSLAAVSRLPEDDLTPDRWPGVVDHLSLVA